MKEAFARGYADGERRVAGDDGARGPLEGQIAEPQGSSAAEAELLPFWGEKGVRRRQEALSRLQAIGIGGRPEGPGLQSLVAGRGDDDEGERDGGAWKKVAFQHNVGVRRGKQTLASLSQRLEEEEEAIKENKKMLERKVAEERRASKNLETYWAQREAEDAHKSTLRAEQPAAKEGGAVGGVGAGGGSTAKKEAGGNQESKDEHKEGEGSPLAAGSLGDYYKRLAARDVVERSHLAVTEDPAKAAEYEKRAADAYFSDGGPEANFKMYEAAESGDRKKAAAIWDKYNLAQTAKEGNIYAPSGAKEGKVDASIDGVHN